MNRVFIYGIILLFLISFGACSHAKDKEEVKSTQGIEIEKNIQKKANQTSKNEDKLYKEKQKARHKYSKDIKKIKKLKEKQRLKKRNLEFYEKRLKIKQERLKEFNSKEDKQEITPKKESEDTEKGENK